MLAPPGLEKPTKGMPNFSSTLLIIIIFFHQALVSGTGIDEHKERYNPKSLSIYRTVVESSQPSSTTTTVSSHPSSTTTRYLSPHTSQLHPTNTSPSSSSLTDSQPSVSVSGTVTTNFFDFSELLKELEATEFDDQSQALYKQFLRISDTNVSLEYLLALIDWDKKGKLSEKVIFSIFKLFDNPVNFILAMIKEDRFHSIFKFFLTNLNQNYPGTSKFYLEHLIEKAFDGIVATKQFELVPSFFNFVFSNLTSMSVDEKKRVLRNLCKLIYFQFFEDRKENQDVGVKMLTYLMSREELDSEFIGATFSICDPKSWLACKTILTYACQQDLACGIKQNSNERLSSILSVIRDSGLVAPITRKDAIGHYFKRVDGVLEALESVPSFANVIALIIFAYYDGAFAYGQEVSNGIAIDTVLNKKHQVYFI